MKEISNRMAVFTILLVIGFFVWFYFVASGYKNVEWAGLIIMCSLLGIMILLSFYHYASLAIKSIYYGFISKSWPCTEGIVISSGVSPIYKYGGKGGIISLYQPRVSCEFVVCGEKYTCDRISCREEALESRGSETSADKVISEFPVEAKVKVFYNPQRPRMALLKPGISAGQFILYLIILTLVVFPILAVFILTLLYPSGQSS